MVYGFGCGCGLCAGKEAYTWHFDSIVDHINIGMSAISNNNELEM